MEFISAVGVTINLPLQVNFLVKLVALKPGKTVRDMIKNVMQGKDEGADDNEEDATSKKPLGGIAGRVRVTNLARNLPFKL